MVANKKSGMFWSCTFSDGFVRVTESPTNPRGVMSNWGKNHGHGLCLSTRLVPAEALKRTAEMVLDKRDKNVSDIEFISSISEESIAEYLTEAEQEVQDDKVITESVNELVSSIIPEVVTSDELDNKLIDLIIVAEAQCKAVQDRIAKLFDFAVESGDIFDNDFLKSFVWSIHTKKGALGTTLMDIIDNLNEEVK